MSEEKDLCEGSVDVDVPKRVRDDSPLLSDSG